MKIRLTFIWKLTLILCLFSAILLVSVGLIAYINGRNSLRASVTAELVSITFEKQNALTTWINERSTGVIALAGDDHIIKTTAALVAAENESLNTAAAREDLNQELLYHLSLLEKYDELFILHPESGEVLVSTDLTAAGQDRSGLPYFNAGKNGTHLQLPFINPITGQPEMAIVTPIFSPAQEEPDKAELAGIMVARLDLNELNEIVQRRTGFFSSDDAFLIGKSYRVITQPRFISEPAVLKYEVHTLAVDKCLAENSGAILADDYRGVPYLIAYRWISEYQICLIVKRSQSEIFAPVASLGRTITIFSLFAFICAAVLAYQMARNISRPIQLLVEGTGQIARGNFTVNITPQSGDEFDALAHSFNQMAASLRDKESELRAWGAELEKRVETRTAELRHSEERYRILAESTPEMVFVIDREDRIQYANSQAAAFLGAELDDMIGMPRLERFPPSITEKQTAGLRHVFDTGETAASERAVDVAGESIWLETTLVPLRDETGWVMAVMGISRDITARKQAEHELKETQEYLENLLECASAPIIVWNSDLLITRYNRAFEVLTGRSAREMLGQPLHLVFPGENKALSTAILESTSMGNQMEAIEIPILRADGSIRIVLWNSAGLYAADGTTLLATIAQGQDISERIAAEKQLLKANQELARSNSELERFAYVASHDLQEPLRMVTSYLQLIVRRYRDRLDGDALEFINYAVDGAVRMKTLINDLLAYSRVGTRAKEFTRTDCALVLERVLTTLKVSIEENQAQITFDNLPCVMADEGQIEQLLQNLIGNAIKFHGKGTPKIHVGLRQRDRSWIFSVRDNGIGIDPQFFDRIFIIFQRLHSREDYQGTGIGLAISKRIVEKHGGEIWVESTPGQGSTFYFTLPVIGE
jgi:PAS domain S-box-containing protein